MCLHAPTTACSDWTLVYDRDMLHVTMNDVSVEVRVRAVLLCLVEGREQLVLLRRTVPGRPVYWVFVGGGVEASDRDERAALIREVQEETGGTPALGSLVYTYETRKAGILVRELFYVAVVGELEWDRRTGPEFADPSRGEYALDLFDLSDNLSAVNILPAEARDFVVSNAGKLRSL